MGLEITVDDEVYSREITIRASEVKGMEILNAVR